MSNRELSEIGLGSRLPELLGGASDLVIDTPPGHTDIVAAAVSSVDTVIIPVEPLAMDLGLWVLRTPSAQLRPPSDTRG